MRRWRSRPSRRDPNQTASEKPSTVHPDIRLAATRLVAAVAAKLDPARAPEALVPLLAAMQASTDPSALQALAQAYAPVAAKLDASRLDTGRQALRAKLGVSGSDDSFDALANAAASTSQSLS